MARRRVNTHLTQHPPGGERAGRAGGLGVPSLQQVLSAVGRGLSFLAEIAAISETV